MYPEIGRKIDSLRMLEQPNPIKEIHKAIIIKVNWLEPLAKNFRVNISTKFLKAKKINVYAPNSLNVPLSNSVT